MVDNYQEIANSEEYQQLKKSKSSFVWPIVLLFIAYYMCLPLMAGYGKDLMSKFVFGNITFGYLYGISYYLVAWVLAFVYVFKARSFDSQSEAIIKKYSK